MLNNSINIALVIGKQLKIAWFLWFNTKLPGIMYMGRRNNWSTHTWTLKIMKNIERKPAHRTFQECKRRRERERTQLKLFFFIVHSHFQYLPIHSPPLLVLFFLTAGSLFCGGYCLRSVQHSNMCTKELIMEKRTRRREQDLPFQLVGKRTFV